MQKSFRSIVLATAVFLTASPALHAGVMGTDPRPVGHVAAPTTSRIIMQASLALLGF